MKINYVIPSMESKKFTGGTLCIYEYIRGLVNKGHEVSITPLAFYGEPVWIDLKAKIIKPSFFPEKLNGVIEGIKYVLEIRNYNKDNIYWQFNKKRLLKVSTMIPDCDINVATGFDTAMPVYLSKKGKMFYFMQHFEEVFAPARRDPELAKAEARCSYLLPLRKIANSSWLKNKIKTEFGEEVKLVNNAIDHSIFYPQRTIKKIVNKKTIVSYGGGVHIWKAITDVAKAIKIIREKMNVEIEWIVYGDSLLKSNNDIVNFKDAGFITGKKLAELYSNSDLVICPSWYESFPLFPIEAMACGTPIVTTPYGVEDYAKDGENCYVVQPRNTEKIAEAAIKILSNDNIAYKFSKNAIKTSKLFTWERSINNLEKVFLNSLNN